MAEKKGRFSRILAAVDGSEQSMKAAEYAIEIAKENNAQLTALSVLDISKPRHLSSTFITAPTYGMRELEEERKEAQQWLDKIANMVSEKGNNNNNINFKSQIEKSLSVEGTIVDYAEQENIDLIVVGTRGRSGFTKLLLGSVASKVVTYAKCPVLVIK
ncbi:MAG TPA: universal stress protein [Nitrososphaeraceae archaeon]|nr:universal stress protein [Nitrososphaeraceae archaeon]